MKRLAGLLALILAIFGASPAWSQPSAPSNAVLKQFYADEAARGLDYAVSQLAYTVGQGGGGGGNVSTSGNPITGYLAQFSDPTHIQGILPTVGTGNVPLIGGGLTIPSGKTAIFNNSLTFNGTDGTAFSTPPTSDTLAGLGTTQTFTAPNTYSQQVTANSGLTVPNWSISSPNSGQSTPNVIYFGGTVNDPGVEFRFNQVISQVNLTTGDSLVSAVLPLISGVSVNSGIYNFGGGGGGLGLGGEHTSGLYGYGFANNSTAWTSGCTVGTTCPGTVTFVNGLNGYADNTGTGELINAYSGIIHSPHTPPAGGETRNWIGWHDDGCFSGINAASCRFLDLAGNEYNGIGTHNPMAAMHAEGGDSTVTGNVVIAGTVLCLAGVPSGPILPYATVTGSGITTTQLTGPAASDVPNGRLCYNINQSQTVSTPTAASFANTYVSFVAQNFALAGNTRYEWIIGNSGVVPNATLDGRYDSTRPLGPYLALSMGGTDVMYATGVGSGRTAGVAIGYTSVASFPTLYAATVGANGLNVDGGYFTGGTAGVSCTSQNVTSINGIVTGCGGGRTPSTNLIIFNALAKANSATVVAGGTLYSTTQTITLTGGTCSTYPVLTVATVSGSAVATVTVSTAGSCTVLPDAPTAQGSTSGSGTGATFQVTWGTITQTYTPTAGISTVDVYAQGPGGSAGGGALQAVSTAVSGGGGGGGGSCNIATFSAAQIGASQNVTIGLPGLQGAPATANTTAGGNAGAAGTTLFGTLLGGLNGGAGGGGQLATTSGGGGGGALTAGSGSTGITLGAGGTPGGQSGGTGQITGSLVANQYAGGGGAGGLATGGPTIGGLAASGAGGGSGGGVLSSNTAQASGAGGNNITAGRVVTAGAAAAANTNGNPGTNQTNPQFCQFAGSAASGGGGALTTTTAGKGGDGGFGSGGGGGGSAQNGTLSAAGWGGLGGVGGMTILEHF